MRHCTCCTRCSLKTKDLQMTTVTSNGHIPVIKRFSQIRQQHNLARSNKTTLSGRERLNNCLRCQNLRMVLKTEQESARRRRQRNHTSTVVSAPGHFVRCAVGMEGTRTQNIARVVLDAPDIKQTGNDCASIMALHDGGFAKKIGFRGSKGPTRRAHRSPKHKPTTSGAGNRVRSLPDWTSKLKRDRTPQNRAQATVRHVPHSGRFLQALPAIPTGWAYHSLPRPMRSNVQQDKDDRAKEQYDHQKSGAALEREILDPQ